jgi:hypothetical protein
MEVIVGCMISLIAGDVVAVVSCRSLSSASVVSRRSNSKALSVSDWSVVTSARRELRADTSDSWIPTSC